MSGAAMGVLAPVLVLVGLLTGCSKKAAPTATSKPAQAEKAVKPSEVQTTPSKKAEPQQFGFSVLSVLPEFCCSDSPGKLVPMGTVGVEGLGDYNTRFALSCFDTGRIVKSKSGSDYRKVTKNEWYSLHTASIEHQDYGNVMTLYIFEGDPADWKPFAHCSILNRIERAKDVAPIRAVSSEFREEKDGSGYQVQAWAAHERYTLACSESSHSPCVSVAPGYYRVVRDGSEFRLCDQNLNLISTYKIVGERGRP